MSFMQAVTSGFKRYVDFQGRSSRSEYWYWVLFSAIAGFVIGFIFGFIQGLIEGLAGGPNAASTLISAISPLVSLALFLPTLAVAIRRLHDTNRGGWWYLLVFTIVGVIPLLIWFCTRGTIGENRFGPDPLGTDEPDTKPQGAWAT
jgi:uncharacterized membrane protein YhaH (DUF805 family)